MTFEEQAIDLIEGEALWALNDLAKEIRETPDLSNSQLETSVAILRGARLRLQAGEPAAPVFAEAEHRWEVCRLVDPRATIH